MINFDVANSKCNKKIVRKFNTKELKLRNLIDLLDGLAEQKLSRKFVIMDTTHSKHVRLSN